MNYTKQQINKAGKMMDLQRDVHESDDGWESRVLESLDEAWENLGALENEAALIKRRIRNIQKVLIG